MKVLKVNDSSLDEQIRSTGKKWADGDEFSYDLIVSTLIDMFKDPLYEAMLTIAGIQLPSFTHGDSVGVIVIEDCIELIPCDLEEKNKMLGEDMEYISINEFVELYKEVLH